MLSSARFAVSDVLATAALRTAGIILLSATALKWYQGYTNPFSADRAITSVALVTLACVGELALGLWLVCGAFPAVARATAICCFALFLVVSLTSAWNGHVSCACFGSLRVSPWFSALLDIAVLVLLTVAGRRQRPVGSHWRVFTAVVLFFAIASPGLWSIQLNRHAGLLTISPDLLDLGTVKPGERIESVFTIVNPTERECAGVDVTSTCACLTFALPRTIPPKQSVIGEVLLDLAKEPNFTGSMEVLVTGLGDEGVFLFQFTVLVSVRE